MADEDRIHPEFADLWPGSQGRIAGALAALERAIGALDDGALDEPLRAEAEAKAHKLVGTLGTYGLVRSAEVARSIEYGFADGPAASDAPVLRERLEVLVAGVRAV